MITAREATTYNLGSGYLLQGLVRNGEIVEQAGIYQDNNNNNVIDNTDTRLEAKNLLHEIGVPSTRGLNLSPLSEYIQYYRVAKIAVETCLGDPNDYELQMMFIQMYSTGFNADIPEHHIRQSIDYLAFQLYPSICR